MRVKVTCFVDIPMLKHDTPKNLRHEEIVERIADALGDCSYGDFEELFSLTYEKTKVPKK